ncbi:flagellar biosynthetic protein FliR [Oceanicella sp. SM1341]|uniref:flagellar biosynthetic protein FliR n=1 Tax=Oceanicella sp. SM1341 TaxID=1548889 RepID=UPI000E4D2CD6|nr:flagellar biosynthetic protein FliR [Oceanicella sp. SM1341]
MTGLEGLAGISEALAALGIAGNSGPALVFTFIAVFARVGAVVTLLPGIGEQTISMRTRLALALALSAAVWPMLAAHAELPGADWAPTAPGLFLVLAAESVAGLVLGLALRFMLIVLQLAGSIAAQSTAISQIAGAGVTPDPMPAMGNILVMAGIALAVTLGLHVKAAIMIAWSYEMLPFGRFPDGADMAAWGTASVARGFALAVTLAGPFVLLSFLYNVALGAINRAMPQLMVAFVGAPFITGAGLALLFLAAPVMLRIWTGALDEVLADPLALPR